MRSALINACFLFVTFLAVVFFLGYLVSSLAIINLMERSFWFGFLLLPWAFGLMFMAMLVGGLDSPVQKATVTDPIQQLDEPIRQQDEPILQERRFLRL